MGAVRGSAVVLVAFLVTASVTGLGSTVGPSASGGLWGVIGNTVVTIDTATGRVQSTVGTTPSFANLEGMAYDRATGTMYGIADGSTDPKLVRIDLQTGTATLVGPIDFVGPAVDLHIAEALAFDDVNRLLYAAVGEVSVPTASYRLAIVDPATGQAREVAPFSGLADADAMAFGDGVLYATDTQPPRTFLYTVDRVTAKATLVGEVGYNHVADLAYDSDTRTLYGTAHTDRLLIRISTADGQGTAVGATHTAQDFGGATLTAISFGPSPASTCTLSVTQGGTSYTVRPVEGTGSVSSFYSYYSASAHTPYVEAYASVLFLYHETTTGRMYVVFHFNIDEGGSPDAVATVGFQDIPPGAGAAVSDDPGEFQMSRYPQGQFQYWLNTDGGALGPLPTDADWALRASLSHTGPEPMRTQKWVDDDGTRLPLAMVGTITVRSACNDPPVPHAGGPYSGVEGSPITFNASASSDPDGDPLTYAWDFQNDGVDDVTTTSPTVQHTYPDDFSGKARLTVSDGKAQSTALANVTVSNVPPSVIIDAIPTPAVEGAPLDVTVRVTDPGTDDVIVEFQGGDPDVPIIIGKVYNPQNYPFTVRATWGDDGSFPIRVTATDDDGGVGQAGAIAPVDNEVPGITAVTNPSATTHGEGAEVDAELRVRDRGSDDVRLDLDWGNGDLQSLQYFNDGVGPDPRPSPGGTYPFVVYANVTTRYADDGQYTFRVTATDDDGGVAWTEFPITVVNVAPTIQPFGPGSSVEGSLGSLTAVATDPGRDDLTFTWEFELGPTIVETFAATGFPTTATSTATFRYGDDGSYRVRLTVTDDDGGVAVYETTVEVSNAPPDARIVQVSRPAAFTLRVAGEKWHDVTATFFQDGAEIAFLRVVRTPGSPNDQAASTDVFDLALASAFTARVVYTPEDDPVNGQPNGANPAWILIGPPGEEPLRIHHTFNVNHPDGYVWDVDLTPELARLGVVFEGFSEDPGSDDLTFTWDFGDGVTASRTHFNDGAGPDGPKTPGGTFPFAATDVVRHAFAGPGTYVVTLTVTDDDGGSSSASISLTIAG